METKGARTAVHSGASQQRGLGASGGRGVEQFLPGKRGSERGDEAGERK